MTSATITTEATTNPVQSVPKGYVWSRRMVLGFAYITEANFGKEVRRSKRQFDLRDQRWSWKAGSLLLGWLAVPEAELLDGKWSGPVRIWYLSGRLNYARSQSQRGLRRPLHIVLRKRSSSVREGRIQRAASLRELAAATRTMEALPPEPTTTPPRMPNHRIHGRWACVRIQMDDHGSRPRDP